MYDACALVKSCFACGGVHKDGGFFFKFTFFLMVVFVCKLRLEDFWRIFIGGRRRGGGGGFGYVWWRNVEFRTKFRKFSTFSTLYEGFQN